MGSQDLQDSLWAIRPVIQNFRRVFQQSKLVTLTSLELKSFSQIMMKLSNLRITVSRAVTKNKSNSVTSLNSAMIQSNLVLLSLLQRDLCCKSKECYSFGQN